MSEHIHDENCDHGGEDEAIEQALELDRQSQIFLELRRQNLELLKLAAEVAGYTGAHPPLKPGDMKHAFKTIWEVFSEFEPWLDPEQGEEEDGDEFGDDE